jgi:nucleoprotein TPR
LEIENMRAGPGGLARSPNKQSLGEDPAAPSTSGRVISERLVIFNNIVELQNQNQKLRASLRNVSESLEKTKADINAAIETKTTAELTEAANIIDELREQLRVSNLKCGSYVRERDQWKRIAESRGMVGSPGKLTTSRPQTPLGVAGEEPVGQMFSEYEQMYKELQVPNYNPFHHFDSHVECSKLFPP